MAQCGSLSWHTLPVARCRAHMRGMRWMLCVLLLSCGHAVSASEVSPGVVAIQCPSGPRGCRQRAVEACPKGFDVVDAEGRPAASYVGELYVRCRGGVRPDALGYRDCMGPESCERGDRCVWSGDDTGRAGRCRRPTVSASP